VDTLTMHRLRLPPSLRRNLATTNLIESAFSTVETVCRNVKRWQHGDRIFAGAQRGLLWAESRWNRIHGYRELSSGSKGVELAARQGIPRRQSSCHYQCGTLSLVQINLGHPRFLADSKLRAGRDESAQ